MKAEFAEAEPGHFQEDEAVAEARNVGFSVGAVPVADRDVADFQVEEGRAEEQVEIAEGIEVAELLYTNQQSLIIRLEKHFCAAKAVLDRLAQYGGQGDGEKLVAHEIQETHCLFFHGVNQSAAVGELCASAGNGVEKLGQIFRRRREVAILNDQHVADGFLKSSKHGVPFAYAGLLAIGDFMGAFIGIGFPLDGFPCIVRAVALDENDFGAPAQGGNTLQGGPNIARLIAGGHDDRAGNFRFQGRLCSRTGDDKKGRPQMTKPGQMDQKAIEKPVEKRDAERQNLFRAGGDYFPA